MHSCSMQLHNINWRDDERAQQLFENIKTAGDQYILNMIMITNDLHRNTNETFIFSLAESLELIFASRYYVRY